MTGRLEVTLYPYSAFKRIEKLTEQQSQPFTFEGEGIKVHSKTDNGGKYILTVKDEFV